MVEINPVRKYVSLSSGGPLRKNKIIYSNTVKKHSSNDGYLSNGVKRSKKRIIKIGKIKIGGLNPIAIQSMLKCKTSDVEKAIAEIDKLNKAGCEIVRLAIKDNQDALAIQKIKKHAMLPLVADIHFNWKLALKAIDSGIDKIRLNPGNIYERDEIKEIVKAAKSNHLPIRVGINSGSLPNKIIFPRRDSSSRSSYSHLKRGDSSSVVDNMVASALDYVKILEENKFYDIVISLKASSVISTIEAYRRISKFCDYPLHLGVTAAGLPQEGAIKSAIAISSLLLEGIGDTIRVSLTDTPVSEVKVAKSILSALRLRSFGPEIISCPTCGRCEVDLVKLVREFKNKLSTVNCKLLTVNSRPVRVAIMGCVVNGPGEAKDADIGVAFGKRSGLLFKSGRGIKKVSFDNCIDNLLEEIKKARFIRK